MPDSFSKIFNDPFRMKNMRKVEEEYHRNGAPYQKSGYVHL